jgi:hypothetical protein
VPRVSRAAWRLEQAATAPTPVRWTRRWVSSGGGLAGPEDPDGDDDAELDGRELIADRLVDEVGWLGQCAGPVSAITA